MTLNTSGASQYAPCADGLSKSSRAAQNLPALDLARFAAAIAVVFYHYGAFFRIVTPDGSNRPYPELLPFAQYGYLGVNLFFLISGFVIFRTAEKRRPAGFLLARARRLFPAFVVCCSVTWVALIASGSTRVSAAAFTYGLTMFNGVFDSLRGKFPVYVDGVYWTLTVEWKFYLLVAAMIFFRRWLRLDVLLWAWLATAYVYWMSPSVWLENWFNAPWAPYFVGGAAVHLVQRAGWRPGLAVLVLAALVGCIVQAMAQFSFYRGIFDLPGTRVECAVVVFVIFVAFIAIATPRIPIGLQSSRTFAVLGALSYPIYLLHQQIGGIAFLKLWTPSNKWVFLFFAICATMIAARIVNECVERRAWNVLERWFPSYRVALQPPASS